MTIEELTAENIELKEQLKTQNERYSEIEKSHKEQEQLIVNLRSKNAELYSRIGEHHEPPQKPKSESEQKADFWNNYIKGKVNK